MAKRKIILLKAKRGWKRKDWQFTRNGIEYTLSVGGLMKFTRAGAVDRYDIPHTPETGEEIVTILGFDYSGCRRWSGCWVNYLSNGKFGCALIKAPGAKVFAATNFQHLDE